VVFLLALTTFVLGALVSAQPSLLLPVVLLVAAGVWWSVRRELAWWDLSIFVVGGIYILEYGFINIGLTGAIPIPLVDLIALALVARIATWRGFQWPSSAPFVLSTALVAVIGLRLVVDFPVHGMLALRDATMGIEVAFLFIGYWAVVQFGLERLMRAFSIIFLIGVVYLLFYPVRESIEAVSPVVGLQRPVPLIGNYVGTGALFAGTFFFFALVRPFGRWSYVLAAATIPMLALQQSRGMYIAMPAAILVVVLASRASTGRQLRRGIVATLGVAVLALIVFFPLAPKEGRLGEVSPAFVVSQLATLTGEPGPGTPVSVRKEWVDRVLLEVDETPWAWAVGVGLGPDLAFGFENARGALVRKPHNDFLEVYARLGLLGLALLIGLLATALTRIVRDARIAEDRRGRFLWFAVAQTIVLLAIAATQPLLAFSYGTAPLFFVLGAALGSGVEVARRRALSDARAPLSVV
jgi:hypothetical protein